MYYKVKVYSAEDSTKKVSYYVKEDAPYVNKEALEAYYKKVTPYQVKVVALPPQVTTLKKRYKVWDSVELNSVIHRLVFYTMKSYEVNDWMTIATFYKEKPFDIEVSTYMGVDYTFFKRPGKYTTNILKTLLDIIGPIDSCSNMLDILGPIRLSRYDDPFVIGKYAWSYDGFSHVHLNKLIGTHKEIEKEQLYC